MPFDAVTRPSLEERLARRGITSVDARTLEAHRLAQLRRFGPNAWYRHRRALAGGLIVLLGLMVGAATWTGPILPRAFGFGVLLTVLAMFAALVLRGSIRLRGGAQWQERWVPAARLEGLGVPAAIAALARDLQREAPRARLLLGELVEDAAVLDPYLLLEEDGVRVCLGIWDEAGIVAQAG